MEVVKLRDNSQVGNWSELPSVERVRVYECSLCQCPQFWRTPYCPHCGAKMEEAKDDN